MSSLNQTHQYIISKSCSIYCCYTSVEPHYRPSHYHFLSNFPIIVFNNYFLFYFNIYTFSTLSPPLPFHLLTTFYINIFFFFSSPHYPLHKYFLFLSLHLPLFCLFLFTFSYYKFVPIYFILCMVFSHKKKVLSLSIFR